MALLASTVPLVASLSVMLSLCPAPPDPAPRSADWACAEILGAAIELRALEASGD
jgi:hypothetical protein